MYSILRGEELDEGNETVSLFEQGGAISRLRAKEVAYNSKYPTEFFDAIVIDECHRSIYNVWKQVFRLLRRISNRINRHAKKTIGQALSRPHDVYKLPTPRTDDKPKCKKAPSGEAAIAEIGNAYHLVQTDGRSKRLTNFVIKLDKKLVTEEETFYSATLTKTEGGAASTTFKAGDFCSTQNFKKRLSGLGISYSFFYGDRELEHIKDLLVRLVERVVVRGKDDITFEFKNGLSVKAKTDGISAN
jgi:hypothetical protein